MTDGRHLDPPSAFVETWLTTFPAQAVTARAVDLATGRGRHAALLARAGYQTVIVDREFEVLLETRDRLAANGCAVHSLCADLESWPLPRRRFDVIVVTRYLQRDLCRAIAEALRPGGVLIYETFTVRQRQHGWGPTSPRHLLAPGELATLFDGLEAIFYEETEEPDAVARLVARASSSRS